MCGMVASVQDQQHMTPAPSALLRRTWQLGAMGHDWSRWVATTPDLRGPAAQGPEGPRRGEGQVRVACTAEKEGPELAEPHELESSSSNVLVGDCVRWLWPGADVNANLVRALLEDVRPATLQQ